MFLIVIACVPEMSALHVGILVSYMCVKVCVFVCGFKRHKINGYFLYVSIYLHAFFEYGYVS